MLVTRGVLLAGASIEVQGYTSTFKKIVPLQYVVQERNLVKGGLKGSSSSTFVNHFYIVKFDFEIHEVILVIVALLSNILWTS